MRKLILSTPKADATQTLFLQSQNTLWDDAAKFSTDEPKNNLDVLTFSWGILSSFTKTYSFFTNVQLVTNFYQCPILTMAMLALPARCWAVIYRHIGLTQ